MTPYSEAKELYNEHKYEEALEKIETAIEKSNNHNIFHYHLYCQILRKLGKAQDFLDLINELIDDEKFGLSEFVNDISWCIYDLYVRDYSENSDYDIVEKAKFILDNCIQPEEENQFSNPLIFTILKIVKVLKRKNYVNYRLIIEILEKLDYNKLSSTDTFQFIDNNDKERELASKREQYYQDLSRAYEKTRKYDECSKLCAIALNDNIKWHYKNDLWLKARKSYCDCMQSNTNDDTISSFVEIAEKNRFWYMYQKLSSVFFSRGNIDESLKYACKAFEIDNDIEKKINLMYDLGLLFEAKNMNLEARDFFQCCLYYRYLHRWKINTDLEYKKQYYEINEKLKPDLIKLKKITISVLRKSLNIGIIKMINQKEKFGFIKINNQKDIYFKTFTIQNKTHFLPIGTFVEYDIERIKDQIRAVNIRGL